MIGGNFQTQSEALGIGALPGRAGHGHHAELLATRLTMTLPAEQRPIMHHPTQTSLVQREIQISFQSGLVQHPPLHPKFGETGYCLGEERKGKSQLVNNFHVNLNQDGQEEEKERVGWLGGGG